MSYFDRLGDGALGCGGGCACGACQRAARHLGETYEPDDDEAPEAGATVVAGLSSPDGAARPTRGATARPGPAELERLLRDGVRSEDRLTDLLFFARHPERRGRGIARGEAGAAREWHAIRERLVRPRLRGGQTPTAPAARGANASPSPQPAPRAGACPIEDPLPQSRHPTGQPCGPGARKCWPSADRWLDLVDTDLPCTAQRDPAAYRAVLRYFNVADARNARYAPAQGQTFCNIFAHDVTRALRASIPHWVRDAGQRTRAPLGWRELNANGTHHWLAREGPSAGWHAIDAETMAAIQRLALAARSAPAGGGAPERALAARWPAALVRAAARMAGTARADPRLLGQEAYIAQQFANLGFPSVASWANPSPAQSGHIAMIAPEAPGSLGARTSTGAFVPRSTQAGRICFEERPAGWVVDARFASRRFFVHP